MGLTLVNLSPGTRSAADYTGEGDRSFVSSQAILDSILRREWKNRPVSTAFCCSCIWARARTQGQDVPASA